MYLDITVLSILLAIFSIAVFAFAIWQANQHRLSSERNERIARGALHDVRAEVTVIKDYAILELRRYGEAMRRILFSLELSRSMGEGDTEAGLFDLSPAPTPTPTPTPTPERSSNPDTRSNIQGDVCATITYLGQMRGQATAMDVTDAIVDKYRFSHIIAEILAMRDSGKISWSGQQDVPRPDSNLQIVEKPNQSL